jgi:ESCRT-I complex subunit VPS28
MVERQSLSQRFTSDETTIELYESVREREIYDEQANLYAIIVATEHLERAYARDALSHQEYSEQCKRLIAQFRMAERVVSKTLSTETFLTLYELDCPRAKERLLVQGVPETIKAGADDHAATVAETVQHFITAMDAVKLEQRAVDELQPLLSDLYDTLSRLPETPSEFEPNYRVKKWLQQLNGMRAVDEISEEDSRQLYHDLDLAYTEFTRFLKRGS